jgi:hypothetical protein
VQRQHGRQIDLAGSKDGINVDVVFGFGAPLDHLDLGCGKIDQGGNVDTVGGLERWRNPAKAGGPEE